VSATITWPGRADITPALREIEDFLDDVEAGKYADIPDDYEVLGRLTGIETGLDIDRWFVDELHKRVRSLIETMAADLELPALVDGGAS
jgi:hypothetical protein